MECLYCGGEGREADKDHIPPRCFLEKPYPRNLKTVRVCGACNRRFSMDEEYAVALLTQIGTSDALTTKIEDGGSVDRAFARRPAFEQRFIDRLHVDEHGRVRIEPELERLNTAMKKVVCGLYWVRYKKSVRYESLGPIGIWPFNIEDLVPTTVFLAAYRSDFRSKSWTIVQRGVFEYMFAKLMDGRLSCIIRWHNTLWVTCVVPWPARRSYRLRPPGQGELFRS